MGVELDDESCYEILGVDPSASTSEIRQAEGLQWKNREKLQAETVKKLWLWNEDEQIQKTCFN